MKIRLFVFLLLLATNINAQKPQFEWSKVSIRSSLYRTDFEDAKVQTDRNGNIYVADELQFSQTFPGLSTITPQDKESMLIVKYNSKGKVLWFKDMGKLSCFQVDSVGNITCAGKGLEQQKTSGGEESNIELTKLDSVGSVKWKKKIPCKTGTTVHNVSVQPDGSVYLAVEQQKKTRNLSTKQYERDSLTQEDALIIQCGRDGTVKKTTTVSKILGFGSQNNLLVFRKDHLYIVGKMYDGQQLSIGTKTFNNTALGTCYLAKLRLDGNLDWVKQFSKSTDNGWYTATRQTDLTTDADGNIYMTGTLAGPAVFDDIEITRKGLDDGFVVKYDSDGNAKWAKQIGNASDGGYGGTSVNGVAVDGSGNVYLTGYYKDKLTLGDMTYTSRGKPKTYQNKEGKYWAYSDTYVVCYDSQGKLLWSTDGGGPKNDGGLKISIAEDGSIILIGWLNDESAEFDQLAVSTDGSGLFVASLKNNLPDVSRRKAGETDVKKTTTQYTTVPKIWAVVIGISRYANEGIRKLNYAAKDATLYYDFLRSPQGGSVPENQIQLLTDEKATRNQIMKALTTTFRQAFENDVIILFVSSHGKLNDNGDQMYFLSYDTDPDYLEGAGISQLDIESSIRRSHASKKIIIADACHSGGVGLKVTEGKKGDESSAQVLRLLNNIAESEDGVAILSASSASESSFEKANIGTGQGIFTYFLVEGLKGNADVNKDGFVNIRELYEYVYTRVVELSGGVQHPELKGNFDNNLPLGIK